MKFKHCVFILLIVITAQSIYAIQIAKPTSLNIEGLTGPVKRIEEQEAELKTNGSATKEGSKRFTRLINFDREGRISHRRTSLNNFDSRDHYYSCDKDGTCRVRYSVNDLRSANSPGAAKEQRSLHLFNYEQNENALFETVYMGDKPFPEFLTQKYKYRFDSSNRIIEKVMMSSAGKPVVLDLYNYSTDHNPLERKLQALGMAEAQIIKYSYVLDAQGNWIKRTEENTLADKNKTRRFVVTYRKITYY